MTYFKVCRGATKGPLIGVFLMIINLVVFRSLSSRLPPKLFPMSLSEKTKSLPIHESIMQTYNTTIIITSSLVPSHPSVELIHRTIQSLEYLHGLPVQSTPIIITVDGAYYRSPQGSQAPKNIILSQYIENLHDAYRDWPNLQIVPQPIRVNLVGNVQKVMPMVQSEYVYMIQHDMPFISSINHEALIRTMQQNHEVRLVRFSPRTTLSRERDKLGLCGDEIDVEANGIALAKTHTWSDNNHFTRKSYYDEMFTTIDGWENARYMEKLMNPLGAQNCSYWGTYLYGKQGEGPPTILHLDGRRSFAASVTETEQPILGINNSNI